MRRLDAVADALVAGVAGVAGVAALVLAAFAVMVAGTALGAFAPAPHDGAVEAADTSATPRADGDVGATAGAGYGGY